MIDFLVSAAGWWCFLAGVVFGGRGNGLEAHCFADVEVVRVAFSASWIFGCAVTLMAVLWVICLTGEEVVRETRSA